MRPPKPLRGEQLERGYKPSQEPLVQHLDGARTLSRPSFTTSARKAEKVRQARPDNTSSSIGYARSSTNTTVAPTSPKAPYVAGRCQGSTNGGIIGVRPAPPAPEPPALTDRQRRMIR